MAGTIDKARMADGEEEVATDGFIRQSSALWLSAAGSLLLTSLSRLNSRQLTCPWASA
jgi:hypothetical protein